MDFSCVLPGEWRNGNLIQWMLVGLFNDIFHKCWEGESFAFPALSKCDWNKGFGKSRRCWQVSGDAAVSPPCPGLSQTHICAALPSSLFSKKPNLGKSCPECVESEGEGFSRPWILEGLSIKWGCDSILHHLPQVCPALFAPSVPPQGSAFPAGYNFHDKIQLNSINSRVCDPFPVLPVSWASHWGWIPVVHRGRSGLPALSFSFTFLIFNSVRN